MGNLTQSTYLVIGAAVVLLAVVLLLLARSGRRPPEGPAEVAVDTPAELSPVAPDDAPPEPAGVPGIAPPMPAPELLDTHPPEELARPAVPEPLGEPDDLTRLKGLGAKAAARLNELGVTRYDQLAALGDDDVDRLDAEMGPFQGRFARDRWVEQARHLAEDDVAGFEAKFGRLG